MIRYQLTPILQEIFDYLSEKAKTAYTHAGMLSEPVLSKNPFVSSFVKDYLEGNFNKKMGKMKLVKTFFRYYRYNVYQYILFIITYCIFRFFFKKARTLPKDSIIIDYHFIVDAVIKEKFFENKDFLNLDTFLLKHNKSFIYLFTFYRPTPSKMFKVFSILKKQKTPFICEFSLLSVFDVLKIWGFILWYPFSVLRYVSQLKIKNEKDVLFKYSILDGIAKHIFLPYARYLQGKRLAHLVNESALLISWYENQTIDKCLYKGINDNTDTIHIIGVQAFLFDSIYLSAHVDENEIPLGAVPHKIYVNGPHYLPQTDTEMFAVGPSFRYKKLFDFDSSTIKEPSTTVILLSYFEENNRLLLNILNNIQLQEPILIKAHPATPIHHVSDFLKPEYQIVNDDIYDLAKSAKVIISYATGAMIEMAALGIPVIVVKGNDVFDYNPMIDSGKGILWHHVGTQEEMQCALDAIDKTDTVDILAMGKHYKERFFCEPNEENIRRMLDSGQKLRT